MFKPNIKVYGIIYGENEIKENYKQKIQKIKQRTHKWKQSYLLIVAPPTQEADIHQSQGRVSPRSSAYKILFIL